MEQVGGDGKRAETNRKRTAGAYSTSYNLFLASVKKNEFVLSRHKNYTRNFMPNLTRRSKNSVLFNMSFTPQFTLADISCWNLS